MIKTFEQFSLCEEVSPKMKRIDFEGEYAILINNLTKYIIEYIKTYGHIVFEIPEDLYFKKNRKMVSENIVSIRVDGKDSKFGMMFANEEYGAQCLVAITEDGVEMPIHYTTAPSNTYFKINDYIYEHI
jgi:S-adenosylmethionine hydrolase